MAITKEQKTEILKDLVDKFSRSKTVVFSDYRGLDVKSMSNLRNQLRDGGAEMKIAKKTLIRLAAQENKIDELKDDTMEGPVAATFSYEDELSGLKILFKFSKENENLKLLGGIIDGKVVDSDVIQKYAKLPGREELLAKFIGSLNSPTSGFVGTLGNVIGGFVRALGAYKNTLPAEEAAAPKVDSPAETKDDTKKAVRGSEEPSGSRRKESKITAEDPKTEVPAEKAADTSN